MAAVSRWFGRVCVAAMAVAVVPCGASAQDRGWWGQRSTPARDARPNEVNERDAAVMYAEARADLDAARFSMAQRRLELLVSRYPQSALTDVARKDLQKLYSLSAPGAAPSTAGQMGARPGGAVGLGAAALGEPARTPDPRASETKPFGDGYRPASLPSGAPEKPAFPAVTSPVATTLTTALRMANEDFRQQAGDRVFFAEGSTDLGARARVALEAQAAWLLRHGDIKIMVEGHADDQGSRDFNRQMAGRRADVVRLRLNDLGVPADRIDVVAHGRNEPLANCPDQACKTQNRRVVTVIMHVPASLGFDAQAQRKLGNAASVVGQPPRAP